MFNQVIVRQITYISGSKFAWIRNLFANFECTMAEFLKILSVFLTCTFFFVKLGVPTAVIVFKYNFVKVMLVSCAGGITGNIIFTYLSATLLNLTHSYREKRNIKRDPLHAPHAG